MGLRRVDRLDGDLPEQLHRLYLDEWWTHRRELDDVRRMLDGSDVVIGFVDEDTGALAGFARVLTDFVYKALVLDVIVQSGYRGTGLGARMMDEVVGHAQLRDVLHFELYCRPELVAFYERWGFTNELGVIQFMRRGQSATPPAPVSPVPPARDPP
jgi:GNAT superfamily N-acetyltransferase